MGVRALALLAVALPACGRGGFDATGDANDDTRLSYPAAILADTPRAYYRLGETNPVVLRDISGNNAHAETFVSNGGILRAGQPGALPGDHDTAMYFWGEGVFGNDSGAHGLFPPMWSTWSGDFTIEAFVTAVNPAPGGNAMALVLCEEYQVHGFRSGWSDTRRLGVWSNQSGGSDDIWSVTTLAANAWTHVAIVHRGAMIELYFDGVLDTVYAFSYVRPTATQFAECGFGAFLGMPADLGIDELAIYDRALSGTQLAAHFAASGR